MREKLIELLNRSFDKQYCKSGLLTATHTADFLIANDVVPVVRCKDCKHFVAPQGVPCCDNFYGLGFPNASGNDFCSYGERKDNDSK